jgi:hypothetical protein
MRDAKGRFTKKQAAPIIHGFKGFDKNMQCRGFQFKEGETYKHEGEAQACNSGFHFCENPLDVFSYYEPGSSLFHAVEGTGQISKHDDDSKVACTEIKIGPSLTLHDFIGAAVKYMLDRKYKESVSNHATGDEAISSTTGDWAASSTTGRSSAALAAGDYSASSATSDYSAALVTGDWSVSSATGDRSAAVVTGYMSASSAKGAGSASSTTGAGSASSATGYRVTSSATGYRSASSVTGYRAISSATGYSSASSVVGDGSVSSATGAGSISSAEGCSSISSTTGGGSASSAKGAASVAVATGMESKAMAGEYGCIALQCWNKSENHAEMRCAEIGCGDGSDGKLKAEVWYRLNEDGKFVEVN